MNDKLSQTAYGGIKGEDYVPYIHEGSNRVFNPTNFTIGLFLAVLFAASNAYAGMISGLTVAAGIPGAIVGAGLLRAFMKNSNILNTNIAQGMSAAGESVASGMIFVFPSIFLIGGQVTFSQGLMAGISGAVLGVGVVMLVHRYLIVEEHGNLAYPEAMAISETLVNTQGSGEGLRLMSLGAAIGGFFTAISNSLFNFVNTTFALVGEKYKWQWATDGSPLLVGIGFIVGMEIAVAMFAGAFLANFVVTPLIEYFAHFANADIHVWNNADLLIKDMSAGHIQGAYSKYIGAGIMLGGGFIGAIKLIPTIINSLKATFGGGGHAVDGKSSIMAGILMALGVFLILVSAFFFTDGVTMALVGTVLVALFIFIFAIVAGKMVGTIGTSNLPVSGMTIASLLIVTITFVILSWSTPQNNISILLLGTMIVTGIATAGGYSQTLKTTFIVGGNRNEVEKHYLAACLVGVVVVVSVIMLLAPQLGKTINPPQAELMATLTKGILGGDLPWPIIISGIFLSFVFYFLKLPIMTVAIGFYLPMGTVTIMLLGAIIRFIVTRKYESDKNVLEKRLTNGTIVAAGLVAGGSLVGLLGAFLAVIGVDFSKIIGTSAHGILSSNAAGAIVIVLLLATFYLSLVRNKK